jgi:hypothetical protein
MIELYMCITSNLVLVIIEINVSNFYHDKCEARKCLLHTTTNNTQKKVVQYYACTIKIIFGRIYEIV